MWFAVFLTSQLSGISAIEFDLQNPAHKSLESIARHAAKPAVMLLLKGKLKRTVLVLFCYQVHRGKILSSWWTHMCSETFGILIISQDHCLDLSGLVKQVQELWKRCLFLPRARQCTEMGSLSARNTVPDVLRWFHTEAQHRTEMVSSRQKWIFRHYCDRMSSAWRAGDRVCVRHPVLFTTNHLCKMNCPSLDDGWS